MRPLVDQNCLLQASLIWAFICSISSGVALRSSKPITAALRVPCPRQVAMLTARGSFSASFQPFVESLPVP